MTQTGKRSDVDFSGCMDKIDETLLVFPLL